MKNLAHKVYITAFCLLGILTVSTTADAQKRKSRSTKAKTTVKAKPKKVAAYQPAQGPFLELVDKQQPF